MASTEQPEQKALPARTSFSLSDLYSANVRANYPEAMRLAAELTIPHPLKNVQYADGIIPCTHAKKHKPFEPCQWDTGPSERERP